MHMLLYVCTYIAIYVHITIDVSHIDALLYDAPCIKEGQPASNTSCYYRDFLYNWNTTRIFRSSMEHEEHLVSVFV